MTQSIQNSECRIQKPPGGHTLAWPFSTQNWLPIVCVLVACCLASPPADAQTPTAGESTPPAAPPNYTYSSDGRRDPFVRTVGRAFVAPSRNPGARPEGVPGLLVAEVVVRGFLESRGAWVAIVGSPDGRSYTLREGDRLMDGTVRAITSDAVVFLQDENDPLSLAKQREVRKYLRGGEQVQ